MKRKYADRPGWGRILDKTIVLQHDKGDTYVHLSLVKVRDPLFVTYGETKLKIVDHNFTWLEFFPKNEGFVITAMFDDNHQLIQCYFDIIHQIGIGENGIPWFDDLYLAVVLLPNHKIILLDEDELDDALEAGVITKKMHQKAWKNAKSLLHFLDLHPDYYIKLAQDLLSKFNDIEEELS
ncbi:hypothetical protein EV207_11949 [Scopulibacillus darangshiensis]|uniref:DUF402 domain-containing protein n=1 Tax=Scopulibacillus darangshiensis TaxID=442528 RepID=A0A4R2NY21_9BACL|nr:DUF402 domain-containing protein [Scopulibacillus darangshiensis]TCP26618.1 hypothetical protein EV207_11949 [Scopulibacillus darangshiensis]